MSYIHGKAIKTIRSPDGKGSVNIVARDDGLFQAHENILVATDYGDAWTVGRISGLYDTAESVEQWARTLLNP